MGRKKKETYNPNHEIDITFSEEDFPVTTTEEIIMIKEDVINYELDDDIAATNLIKYEFNMIELPFFTRNKKVENGRAKRYTFSERNKSYMRVVPSGDPQLISNKIPQEFDEKIFYGILKLSREQNSKEVITDYFTLAKSANVHYKNLERIKDSLERLNSTSIEIRNLFYNAADKQGMTSKEDFRILQHLTTYTFDDIQKLAEDKQGDYKKYFRNSKISEVLIIGISDHMYRNIEQKGFLYFNQDALLEVENAAARKLYILITKWHGWEKKNVIRRSCGFLASRIPFSWEKKAVLGTINSLEKACQVLKEKNLLLDYVVIRRKPLTKSFVDFSFSDKHNRVMSYNRTASVETGHERIMITNMVDEFLEEDDRQTKLFDETPPLDAQFVEKTSSPALMSENIISALPEKLRTLVNQEIIQKHLHQGNDYCISNIRYSVANYKENFTAYLSKALQDDWSKGEREQEQLKRDLQNQHEEALRKEEEEKTRQSEFIKEKAATMMNAMNKEEYKEYAQEAKESMIYKIMMENKVKNNEIDEATAIKEVILALLSNKFKDNSKT